MKEPISKFAASLQSAVYPKTVHQFRPVKAGTEPKPPGRDNVFSKSRDLREDRGIREIKTSSNGQTSSKR